VLGVDAGAGQARRKQLWRGGVGMGETAQVSINVEPSGDVLRARKKKRTPVVFRKRTS
jgi:hypothetical protein